jgi:hypothetical protein
MSTSRCASFGAISVLLAACGTFVPDIQEFWGTPLDATYKVNKVSAQVVCELRKAVQRVVYRDPPEFIQTSGAPPRHPGRGI